MKIDKTGILALCTAASRLFGFIRIALIGMFFGASGSADVLNLVFQIPNNLRRLLAEGAFSNSLIPVMSNTLQSSLRPNQESRRLLHLLLGTQLLLFIPFIFLLTLFSHPITATIFAFTSPLQIAQSSNMFRLLMWYILPISISATCMATLNLHEKFTISAISPLISSCIVIAAMALLRKRIDIYSVAIGLLLGGLSQVLVQIPQLMKIGYTIKLKIDFNNKALRMLFRNWIPIAFTASLFAVNQHIAVYFASGLKIGSGSAMIYALTFWQLPFGILGVSALTVLFPQMSRLFAQRKYLELYQTRILATRYLMAVMIPATIYLFILSEDIIHIALQRGAFSYQNTIDTARVLKAYSVGLLGVCLYQLLQRFCYACHNTKLPIYVLMGVIAVDIPLSLWLKETALGVAGLAVANSVAFWLGVIVLFCCTRKYFKTIARKKRAITHLLKLIGSALPPTALLLLYKRYIPLTETVWFSPVLRGFALLVISCLFGVFVLLLYTWLKVDPHPKTLLLKRYAPRITK